MTKSRFFLYFLTRFYFQYWSWSVSRICSLGFPAFSSLLFTKRKKKISDRSLMVGFPGLSSRQKPFTCCCRSPASHAVSSPRPTAPAAVPSPAAVRNSGTPEKPAEPWWHAFPLSQSAPSLPRQRAGPEPQLFQPEKIKKNKKNRRDERVNILHALYTVCTCLSLKLNPPNQQGKSISSENQQEVTVTFPCRVFT